jgi:hypothetical protein
MNRAIKPQSLLDAHAVHKGVEMRTDLIRQKAAQRAAISWVAIWAACAASADGSGAGGAPSGQSMREKVRPSQKAQRSRNIMGSHPRR